ncbi:hypothetical protein Pint_17164 [Pistacia integerrima]|uniref:Uncharacterized protein n=1 Tax=Pistacia integerrima TaxID=434235 RepID=A0ACC0YWJ6_9ROSI|nr:hypothetical protein Pint_17164 [Pistacia integerrima]
MASLFLYYLVAFFCYLQLSSCFYPKHLNLSSTGTPSGRLPEPPGGTCGYGSAVSQCPFSSLVTAIGPNLHDSGKSNMHGKQIVFHADQGSNPNYFAVVVEFEAGDGDLGAVDLKEGSGSGEWRSMTQNRGERFGSCRLN